MMAIEKLRFIGWCLLVDFPVSRLAREVDVLSTARELSQLSVPAKLVEG